MWTMLATFIAGLFSSSKATDVAIDALRKLGNLDSMTDQEKAQFILTYIEQTKHDSPARRFIAMLTVGLWTFYMLVWIIMASIGYLANYMLAVELAGAIKVVLLEIIKDPYTIILSFYFVMNIIQKVGK
jgi:hypothetical protein